MGEVTGAQRDVDQILRRIRTEVARLHTKGASSGAGQIARADPYRLENLSVIAPASHAAPALNPRVSGPPRQSTVMGFEPVAFQPAFKTSVDDRYRLSELLVYHDRAFVEAAYWALLHRAPDRGGLETYLQHLHAGRSKIEILGLLRFSPEGRVAAVKVTGLIVPFAIARVCAWPVVGSLLRFATALARLPRMQRRQNVFEDRTIALLEQTQANLQDSLYRITRALRDLDNAFDYLTACVSSKPGRDALTKLEASIATLKEALNARPGPATPNAGEASGAATPDADRLSPPTGGAPTRG